MTQKQISGLADMLDEAFSGPAWHGPSLKGSLRSVTAEQAAWRPAADRHNIWEVAVHAAYWKHAVRRRLNGEKRSSFGEKGSNWFLRPPASGDGMPDTALWQRDLSLLSRAHQDLRAVVLSLADSDLERRSKGKYTVRRMIAGIAMHDVYHAGQIQILKRLLHRG